MAATIHANARSARKIRAEGQSACPRVSNGALARRYGITKATIAERPRLILFSINMGLWMAKGANLLLERWCASDAVSSIWSVFVEGGKR